MLPLILLCALAGAILAQAFIRMLIAPGRTWVAATGRSTGRAASRSVDPAQEIDDWENEGGSLAVSPRRRSEGGT
jgi:hypothetical protein